MPKEVKKFGVVAILMGILGSLLTTVVVWSSGQIVNIKPMTKSIDKLTLYIEHSQLANVAQHKLLKDTLHELTVNIAVNNTKLDNISSVVTGNKSDIRAIRRNRR